MRICSLLPGGTEIAGFLGLEQNLVGVTHECDFPPSALGLPKIVRSRFDARAVAPGDIDRLVAEALRRGESLYEVDEPLLMDLKPDLVLAQDLCEVCAPSGNQTARLLGRLPPHTRVVTLSPTDLDGIFENIRQVARAAGIESPAEEKIRELSDRIRAVRGRWHGRPRRSVFFMEWPDPVFCAGHWIPELVDLAGGWDPLARPGQDSIRMDWRQVAAVNPEFLVVAPCGFHLEDSLQKAKELLPRLEGIADLNAARNGRIYAVDADGYFVRPGPRVVQGIEVLAELFHPEACRGLAPAGAAAPVELPFS